MSTVKNTKSLKYIQKRRKISEIKCLIYMPHNMTCGDAFYDECLNSQLINYLGKQGY